MQLPDDKILIPGVVSHCIHLVEHPELVAQRIVRFAEVIGRGRVIAGTDCGFGTSGAGDEVHPDVAWAKLRSLVEGARIASKKLWAGDSLDNCCWRCGAGDGAAPSFRKTISGSSLP